ncbi:MAG: glycogen debranching protein GlgX [Gammaproteobacteria bacterium]|nr:glycogen debranching protein GlgX [Gammaproteobacteria bacterium]
MASASARLSRELIRPGQPGPLGATVVDGGVNFAVHSSIAESVFLCLFDETGREFLRRELPAYHDGTWHGFLPGAEAGLQYGYRVDGPYRTRHGMRCNPHKLLSDPYARALTPGFHWHESVFGYQPGMEPADVYRCELDSAPYVPKCIVVDAATVAVPGPQIPWSESVSYELNVRGYTMRFPDLNDAERGKLPGLKNGAVLHYLRALGITAVELMPVHEFIDEHFLTARGLRNFWGYNTLNFFTPASRYANGDPRGEFIDMVNAIHDAGLEVILDVVYNHTAEGDHRGPTLSFRGFDNAAYYRLAHDKQHYINDTGCGNTINADSCVVQDLVVDSLRYWAGDLGVDGFRFDLAPILGRRAQGFDTHHPLLQRIQDDPLLKERKLIAEPWDAGPGGYQLGAFAPPWAELNDRYRDTVRRWWRGDAEVAPEFARRLHGSSDLFEHSGRAPHASVNFISNHDGFTLADTVTYVERHNEANGEQNRDGHSHNFSANYGVEGITDDAAINALRRRQRVNMLATLFLSQGMPLLLAGDEFGNTQGGNNNAYAQDNETAWLDWDLVDSSDSVLTEVRELLALRREEPLLQMDRFLHGTEEIRPGWPDIQWLAPSGEPMAEQDWATATTLTLLLAADINGPRTFALLMNNSETPLDFSLGAFSAGVNFTQRFASGAVEEKASAWTLSAHCLVCLQGQFT